jgi:hypothetical protein
MAIVFHCEYCGKEIKAADTAGGKWGKCPGCHNRVYVPNLEADEELKLAPIDTQDQEREKQLMEETYKLTQDILRERETPDGDSRPAGAMYEMSDDEILANIIKYFQQMSYGDLDEAERTATLISPFKAKANEMIDKIALNKDTPEPELEQISPQLLIGFIKTLRLKIGK